VLVDAGANLDVRDFEGKTPLMIAAVLKHSEIVEMLVQAVVQPQPRTEPRTPNPEPRTPIGDPEPSGFCAGVELKRVRLVQSPHAKP
jgi:ankyrin repeat protein